MSNLRKALEESSVSCAELSDEWRWAVVRQDGTDYEIHAGLEGYPSDTQWTCSSYEETVRYLSILEITESDAWKPQEEEEYASCKDEEEDEE